MEQEKREIHAFAEIWKKAVKLYEENRKNAKKESSRFSFALPEKIWNQYCLFKKGTFWSQLSIEENLQTLDKEINNINAHLSNEELINQDESENSKSKATKNEDIEGNNTIREGKDNKSFEIVHSKQQQKNEIDNPQTQNEKAKHNLEEELSDEKNRITSQTEEKDKMKIKVQESLRKMGLTDFSKYIELLHQENKEMAEEYKQSLKTTNMKFKTVFKSLKTIAESLKSCVVNLEHRIMLLGLVFYSLILRKSLHQLLLSLAEKKDIKWKDSTKTKLIFTKSVQKEGNELTKDEGTKELDYIYDLKNETNSIIHLNVCEELDKKHVMPDVSKIKFSELYHSNNLTFNDIYGDLIIDLNKEDPENLTDSISLKLNQN